MAAGKKGQLYIYLKIVSWIRAVAKSEFTNFKLASRPQKRILHILLQSRVNAIIDWIFCCCCSLVPCALGRQFDLRCCCTSFRLLRKIRFSLLSFVWFFKYITRRQSQSSQSASPTQSPTLSYVLCAAAIRGLLESGVCPLWWHFRFDYVQAALFHTLRFVMESWLVIIAIMEWKRKPPFKS